MPQPQSQPEHFHPLRVFRYRPSQPPSSRPGTSLASATQPTNRSVFPGSLVAPICSPTRRAIHPPLYQSTGACHTVRNARYLNTLLLCVLQTPSRTSSTIVSLEYIGCSLRCQGLLRYTVHYCFERRLSESSSSTCSLTHRFTTLVIGP